MSDWPGRFAPWEGCDAIVSFFDCRAHGASGFAGNNTRIRRALTQQLPMRLNDGATLDDVVKYVRQATRASYGGTIPMFVDPIGLAEADKSTRSTVAGIDLDGVSLGTSLSRCLRQLDRQYVVKDGLQLVTSAESEEQLVPSQYTDPFQIVGHCLMAPIAAGLGGAAAPVVCDLARKARADIEGG
jgi:hypothetical protein